MGICQCYVYLNSTIKNLNNGVTKLVVELQDHFRKKTPKKQVVRSDILAKKKKRSVTSVHVIC